MRKKYNLGGHTAGKRLKEVIEKMGGSEKAKPHSTKKGRIAAGARRVARVIKNKKIPDARGGFREFKKPQFGKAKRRPRRGSPL